MVMARHAIAISLDCGTPLLSQRSSPMRASRPLTDDDAGDRNNNNDIRLDLPAITRPRAPTSPILSSPVAPVHQARSGSAGEMVIPTFTVTVNPMEADEMTFVPDSPTKQAQAEAEKRQRRQSGRNKSGGSKRRRLTRQISMEVRVRKTHFFFSPSFFLEKNPFLLFLTKLFISSTSSV